MKAARFGIGEPSKNKFALRIPTVFSKEFVCYYLLEFRIIGLSIVFESEGAQHLT
jgi:hypothetical protein